MEKSITTPDAYPLTLNALIAACNQKSSREPVMNLSSGEVQRTLRLLEEQLLVSTDSRSGRVEKYLQRFGNTPFAVFEFSPPQFAVLTVLMLRGPQTPGELRARGARMYEFSDNNDVLATLRTLIEREDGPMVAQLPMRSGRRDHEYAQLFSGTPGDAIAEPVLSAAPAPAAEPGMPPAGLAARVTELEQRVAALEAALSPPADPGT